jgi:hypothetical protein
MVQTLASGGSVLINHGYGIPPVVYLLKQVGILWVEAVGTYDAAHDAAFNTLTITNTTPFAITYYIRLAN